MRKIFMFGLIFFMFYFLISLPPDLSADLDPPFFDIEPNISMDFQDANLRDILKALSIQSGLNFIAPETVQNRKITLYLDGVSLKQAMDKLFKANNLSYELDKASNIFIVKDWGKPIIETETRIFYLKYATVSSSSLEREKAANLGASSTTASTGSSSAGSGSSASAAGSASGASAGITEAVKKLLSPNGSLIEDSRTNSLIVTDIPTRIPLIAKVIESLDVPVPQVMLEVEMLDVTKNAVDKLGFKFGQTPFTAVLTGVTRGTNWPLSGSSQPFTAQRQFTPGSIAINTGANTYSATMDFLRTLTDTKILARPRILTLNNETAEIKITTEETIGTIQTTSTGGGEAPVTTVVAERTETGVSLRVTPQINFETGVVTMFLMPVVKDTTTTTLTGIVAKDPEERSTKSVVRIMDGDTVVIGGLIRHQFSEVITKLPVLGDIPILGSLFRHKNKEPDKQRELLVFITPHIIKEKTDMKFVKTQETAALDREQETPPFTLGRIGRELEISEKLDKYEQDYE